MFLLGNRMPAPVLVVGASPLSTFLLYGLLSGKNCAMTEFNFSTIAPRSSLSSSANASAICCNCMALGFGPLNLQRINQRQQLKDSPGGLVGYLPAGDS
mmetsp:Transcript_71169/g.214053  ORF Transcript_71169/g.214053 Transcript_71169/m.214053 type:complete len:99 (+) Transcript_71169:2088-2384(+)